MKTNKQKECLCQCHTIGTAAHGVVCGCEQSMTTDKQKERKPEKDIICYFCGGDKLTACFMFDIEEKPLISINCADCKEPLMGVHTTMGSLRFILDSEDRAAKLKREGLI